MLASTSGPLADLEARILRVMRERDDDLAAKVANLAARIGVLEQRLTTGDTRIAEAPKHEAKWWQVWR